MNTTVLQERLNKHKEPHGQRRYCTHCKYAYNQNGERKCRFIKNPIPFEEEKPCATAYGRMVRHNSEVKKEARGLWTRNKMRELLLSNRNAVTKAIVTLYEIQSQDEQQQGVTLHHDGAGFSRNDIQHFIAPYHLIKRGMFYAEGTTQYYKVRGRLLKYAKQLANIANNKRRR